MKLFSCLLSGLASLLGLGGERTLAKPVEFSGSAPLAPCVSSKEQARWLRRGSFHHRGRHSRGYLFCPACLHSTSKRGLCMNRMCTKFNAATARTHPDLLSLDWATRTHAQNRWARGGMAALWAA